MTPTRRLVLAASDPRLAQAVQAHLARAVQLVVPVVRFEDVPHLLAPDTDGDVLLVAGDPGDAAAVEAVVRETKVQVSPAGLAVVEADALAGRRAFDHLAPYLAGQWAWPHHVRELTTWARRAQTPGGVGFADPSTESTAETIRRKLVNHTPSLTTMVDQLCIAAAHDVTVLIEGETGTGKE
ncbi:MAG TPA: sigma 54-interacting transcriptional regulator, partial [Urbifossiella sp.]|nr:sigma 54-interacting transcriptional regulator [Urbifossiella sp.]